MLITACTNSVHIVGAHKLHIRLQSKTHKRSMQLVDAQVVLTGGIELREHVLQHQAL